MRWDGSLAARLALWTFWTVGFLAASPAAWAQIVVNGTSGAAGPASKVSSLSWPHTVGAGANRILVVGVSLRDGSTAVTVTYGGTPLTLLGFQVNGNQARTEMWRLLAPPTGTATVAMALSAPARVAAGAASFSNILMSSPHGAFVSAAGGVTTASLTVPSAAGELVVDSIGTHGDVATMLPGAGQAQMWNSTTGATGSDAKAGGSSKPGSTTVTMSWSLSKAKAWAMGAISLRPAPAPLLTLIKSVDQATAPPGAVLGYSVVYSNTGAADAFSIVLSDPVPPSTTYVAGSASGAGMTITFSHDGGGTYDASDALPVTHVRWTRPGPLPPGGSGTVAYSVSVD